MPKIEALQEIGRGTERDREKERGRGGRLREGVKKAKKNCNRIDSPINLSM